MPETGRLKIREIEAFRAAITHGSATAAAGALRDGTATGEDLARLERWSVVLRGRGACATLDAATNIAASLLATFPDEVARHLTGDCPDCGGGVFTAERPFEVVWVEAR